MTSTTTPPPVSASAPTSPIHLDGGELVDQRHVCAFFRDEEEQYRLLMPFIEEGLANGERAFHIVDPRNRERHLRRLADAGIDVDGATRKGALEVTSWPEAHLRENRFDQNAMLTLIQDVLGRGRPAYPLTRFIANMEWALEPYPGVGDLVEYEARLNDVLPGFIDPVICTYDLGRFGAGVVVDMLRTHPVAVVGNMLQENPYYVSVNALRAELREARPADVA